MDLEFSNISVGKVDFIEGHGLWDEEKKQAAERVLAQVGEHDLQVIRVSMSDQHGILKGKTLLRNSFENAMRNGIDFTVAPIYFDTGNTFVFNAFSVGGGFGRADMAGFPDAILVPDPLTFRILPWAPNTGWILADWYFSDGRPVEYSTRRILQDALSELHRLGLEYLCGLEVEWYLTKLEDRSLRLGQQGGPGVRPDPPEVTAVAHGYQYLDEWHNDQIDPILAVLRENLLKLGLPLRTMEDEWGPGQCEFTFEPLRGVGSADAMLLFRSAMKQICHRNGYHATFMCSPAFPGFFASGWHLHQSLLDSESGANAFMSTSGAPVSDIAKHFIGGILEHAAEASVFTTPTINGYRRRKPFSLAPDRATWGIDNRGAMIRVQGEPGDPSTHIENRVGEPAANPYLYMASQIIAGIDGIKKKADPGEPSDNPYAEHTRAPLPTSLMEAVSALKASSLYRDKMGDQFVDYIVQMKEHEISRFLGDHPDWADHPDDVTAWEHREYFEHF